MNELDQEIEWVLEEIAADEWVMDSANASKFHANRLRENRETLTELMEQKLETQNTESEVE